MEFLERAPKKSNFLRTWYLLRGSKIRNLINRGGCQGAFHVVNPQNLQREIELILGVATYILLPWRGGATLFCFLGVVAQLYFALHGVIIGVTLFTIITNDFILVFYCQSHIENTKLYT